MNLQGSFWKKFRAHLLPLAGELGNAVVLLGMLGAMFVVNGASQFVRDQDGKLWPLIVRWIFNIQLLPTLLARVVSNARELYREISKPWKCPDDESHEIPLAPATPRMDPGDQSASHTRRQRTSRARPRSPQAGHPAGRIRRCRHPHMPRGDQ